MLEADIGPIRERLAEHRRRVAEPVSITSYVAKSFACAINDDKRMQAYRLGKSRLVVFDDIDLVFMVEREWEGEPLPVFSIVRAAQRKAAHEIHCELQAARESPLGIDGPMNALEMQFFLLPSFLRTALWFFVRRNPYWFKDVAGTAAVTSMGMFTSGATVGVPITPMTLSLCIGSIEKKLALVNGQVVERDVIHLNISVDHDIIDGAPLVRQKRFVRKRQNRAIIAADVRRFGHAINTDGVLGTHSWQQAPQYIVRDRDYVYGDVFIRRVRAMGIRDRPIAPRSPWQNGHADRLIGSIRRDCLDHVVVFGERHLRHLLGSYQKYYNDARTHLSLNKDAPASRAVQAVGRIVPTPHLGGLHHQYVRI
jgi:hypothetical protein